jgi:hypothetical protein
MKQYSLAVAATAAALACLVPSLVTAQSTVPQHPAMHRMSTVSTDDAVFSRIAPKLYTSPDHLQREFAAACKQNAKLTRSEYLTAAVLSHNLSGDHPDVTTQAILSDIRMGRTFRRALEGRGLKGPDALTTLRTAQREVHAAEQNAPDMSERAHPTKKDSTKRHGG